MIFDKYEFKDYLVKAIKDLGFTSFTSVQKEVFNEFNNKKNILAKSKTGSGKTHAFLLPIFENLNEENYETQAIIISPTKELAMQTYKVAQHLASFCDKRINIKLYSGGTDRNKEIEKLDANMPQIVIGTPGKIKDLAVTLNVLKIYTASYFVVDEMDMALENGFQDDIDAIAAILKNSKMMFFSATVSNKILPFVKKYLDTPEYINILEDTKLNIKHIWIPLKHKERYDVLKGLLNNIQPYFAIIFANKKETVIELSKKLKTDGFDVYEMHGDLTASERKRVLADANKAKFQYLVATDLAARGIDIDGVSHVIQYEIPLDYEFYIHRSGRTGRMNYSGTVYTIYEELDNEYLDNLAKKDVTPEYYEIKGDEIIPYKGRNTRAQRIKPKTNYEQIAAKFVPKATKVTPGYKKARQQVIKDVAKKMAVNDQKKKKRY